MRDGCCLFLQNIWKTLTGCFWFLNFFCLFSMFNLGIFVMGCFGFLVFCLFSVLNWGLCLMGRAFSGFLIKIISTKFVACFGFS